MSTLYHVAKADGTRYGQMEAADIIAKLRSGEWGKDVLIWQEGWADWQSAAVLSEPGQPARPWGLISATKSVFGYRILDFRGRAGRPEYWYSVLGLLLGIVLLFLSFGLISGLISAMTEENSVCSIFFVLALPALIIYVTLARIALIVRRLHDVGMSGWWFLLSLLPPGDLFILIIALLPSSVPNRWGKAPQQPLP